MDEYVKTTLAANYGSGSPRLVLFSPIAHEDLKNANFPDGSVNNQNLQLYTAIMAEVAAANKVQFVDLYHPSLDLYGKAAAPLTINGIHLTETGDKALAPLQFAALFGQSAASMDDSRLETIRAAVLEKNVQWHHRYRTVDQFNIYGQRSRIKYEGVDNATILGEEMAQRDVKTANRDLAVPRLLEETATYPGGLARRPPGPPDAEVTLSLVAGPDRQPCERTLNSFLHCCTDVDYVGRFLVLDTGLSDADRTHLSGRYPFLEFLTGTADMTTAEQTDRLAAAIGGRYWLHSGQGWQYFAADPLITRLSSVLQAEPGVSRVGINYGDATTLTGTAAPADTTRTATGTGRYVLTDQLPHGPTMIDTDRFDTGPRSTRFARATLDEVLCINVR
jgi:hypothetical protein